MSADQLAESCAAIAAWLPVAQALTTQPDITGATAHGQPASRPPWNPAAENAAMDAHEGLRRLRASLHRDVHGSPGTRCGGSDANTMQAIRDIERLGAGVTVQAMAQAARILDRWSRQIQELPAVDEAEPWRRVEAACPYCGFGMLRVRARSGEVTCLRYGACRDSGGQHPVGHLDVSVLNGDPIVRWNDGLVT